MQTNSLPSSPETVCKNRLVVMLTTQSSRRAIPIPLQTETARPSQEGRATAFSEAVEKVVAGAGFEPTTCGL